MGGGGWGLRRKSTKEKKNARKDNCKKCPEKSCFWVAGRKWNLPKVASLDNLQNTVCVWKGEENTFSRTLSALAKSPFSCFFEKPRKHYKDTGFSRQRVKPRIPFFQRRCFWKGSLKGCLLSLIHKSCAPLKTLFLWYTAQLLQKRRVWVTKAEHLPKIGGCVSTWRCFFSSGVVLHVWFGVVGCVVLVYVCVFRVFNVCSVFGTVAAKVLKH